MITYLVRNGNMLFRVSEINIKYAQEKPSEKKKESIQLSHYRQIFADVIVYSKIFCSIAYDLPNRSRGRIIYMS